MCRLQKLNQVLLENKDKTDALNYELEKENTALKVLLEKVFHKLNVRESQNTRLKYLMKSFQKTHALLGSDSIDKLEEGVVQKIKRRGRSRSPQQVVRNSSKVSSNSRSGSLKPPLATRSKFKAEE